MTGKRNVCRYLIALGGLILLLLSAFSYYYVMRVIPDQLNIVVSEEEQFHFTMPLSSTLFSESEEVVLNNGSDIPSNQITIQGKEPFSLYSNNQGSYRLGIKLFGWLQLKEIQVDVVDTRYAIPCGVPIGIYLKSDGIMVIGTGKVTDTQGMETEPAMGILKSGDYIESINGQPLKDKEELVEAVNKIGNSEAVLQVRRDGQPIEVKMSPIATSEGDYKLGVWVRSDTQGIGTMTYLDLNGNFGALGHGISDMDTSSVVEITNGTLYDTEIMGIEKGTIGKPGVMSGVIYYGPGSTLGTIESNTDEGIFGIANERLEKQIQGEPMEIGYRQDVVKGQAFIRSAVSGELKDYEIEIQKVDYSNNHKTKGMVIKVVDEELLNLTGGIVQGMSGSPIIQNGKLIGAVTHVFIQDSTRGYGIFVENMIEH
ncbi:SpoIVB peptidase [Clostridium sp. MCC353]|uniref:SpoIVB peptidase n=1 Tax=Clostridium sp. MCC353 TaxID=2592646 RepID=UPI001C025C32|nr:SpoIVB peptidase [Clostridium sp. MCC353]MBT9778902.1 SpoIVB peptidase [Clostridium sp. MCC353]